MNLIRRFTGEWHVSSLKTWGLGARTPSEEVFMLLLLSSGHWMVSSNCYLLQTDDLLSSQPPQGCCGYCCYCFWGLDGCRHLALSWHAKTRCPSYNPPFSLWLWMLCSILIWLDLNSKTVVEGLSWGKVRLAEKRGGINNSNCSAPLIPH